MKRGKLGSDGLLNIGESWISVDGILQPINPRLHCELACIFELAQFFAILSAKCLLQQLFKNWHLSQCFFYLILFKATRKDLLKVPRECLRI